MAAETGRFDIEVNAKHIVSEGFNRELDILSYKPLTDAGKYWLNANDHRGELQEDGSRTVDRRYMHYLASNAEREGVKVVFIGGY